MDPPLNDYRQSSRGGGGQSGSPGKTMLCVGNSSVVKIYIEFPTHNIDFHLLTTSVNAKYYY